MIDQEKWQELKDAAAHAKHNGGRVSVDWDVLDELLGAWQASIFGLVAHFDAHPEEIPQPIESPALPDESIPMEEPMPDLTQITPTVISGAQIAEAEATPPVVAEEPAGDEQPAPLEPTIQ